MSVRIVEGDALTVLRTLPDRSVQMCCTSPPYFGLRDYGTASWEGGAADCDHKQGRPGAKNADGIVDHDGPLIRNRDGVGAMGGDCQRCGAVRKDRQLGLEKTPQLYVDAMVGVFSEVKRVLRDDGTLWLNIGDSYGASPKGSLAGQDKSGLTSTRTQEASPIGIDKSRLPGVKVGDLIGIPWLLAFALRSDGWFLRSEIIWHKLSTMPESVGDRPTRSHEQLFLLTKNRDYYYDASAIAEPIADSTSKDPRFNGDGTRRHRGYPGAPSNGGTRLGAGDTRNKRTVWSLGPAPFQSAHFATFPPKLIEPCILAGSAKGQTVLDPFGGAGTTGLVADRLGRDALLIELNTEYAEMARKRIHSDNPLFTDVA